MLVETIAAQLNPSLDNRPPRSQLSGSGKLVAGVLLGGAVILAALRREAREEPRRTRSGVADGVEAFS
jgi:hypothetical protein